MDSSFARLQDYVTQDYREVLNHGTDDFRMSVHGTKVTPGTKLALYYHWHEELEFFYITAGKVKMSIGNQTYRMERGDVAVIQPGVPHAAYRDTDADIEFYAVLSHMRFLASVENDAVQNKYIYPIFLGLKPYPVLISRQSEINVRIQEKLMGIIQCYQSGTNGYELMIKSFLYSILYDLSRAGKGVEWNKGNQYNDRWVKAILSYVKNRFNEKIRLKDMAEFVNMSEGHLCRSMQRVFHVSPMEFLNRYRVAQAVSMIEETDKKLTDIAFDTGFCNSNRFTISFRNTMHCTPAEYRKKIKGNLGIKPEEGKGI